MDQSGQVSEYRHRSEVRQKKPVLFVAMKLCLWIAGLALLGLPPKAEESIQSHCREKWPGKVHMMMY